MFESGGHRYLHARWLRNIIVVFVYTRFVIILSEQLSRENTRVTRNRLRKTQVVPLLMICLHEYSATCSIVGICAYCDNMHSRLARTNHCILLLYYCLVAPRKKRNERHRVYDNHQFYGNLRRAAFYTIYYVMYQYIICTYGPSSALHRIVRGTRRYRYLSIILLLLLDVMFHETHYIYHRNEQVQSSSNRFAVLSHHVHSDLVRCYFVFDVFSTCILLYVMTYSRTNGLSPPTQWLARRTVNLSAASDADWNGNASDGIF